MIACDRRIAEGTAAFRDKKWDKKGFGKGCSGLCGRRIAVIGLGGIGKLMVKYCLALGMQVVGFSRSLTKDGAAALGIEYAVSPTDACAGADAVSFHLPLKPETKGMVGRSMLSGLNDGAIVINTSRGGVINEAELLEVAAAKGLKFGADVFCDEPAATDKELKETSYPLAESDCLKSATHHIGASTQQAEEAVGFEVLHIINEFTAGGVVPNCVNLELDTAASYSLTIRHEDKVGVLASILNELSIESINIEQMQNIIFKGGEAGCAKIEVSKKPSAACSAKLSELPHIISVEVTRIK